MLKKKTLEELIDDGHKSFLCTDLKTVFEDSSIQPFDNRFFLREVSKSRRCALLSENFEEEEGETLWNIWLGSHCFMAQVAPEYTLNSQLENLRESVEKMNLRDAQDNINQPPHYTQGNIECIDVIEDWKLSYAEGNVLKYLCRYKHKNGLEDLKKAKWYLDKLISLYTVD